MWRNEMTLLLLLLLLLRAVLDEDDDDERKDPDAFRLCVPVVNGKVREVGAVV
jgi:hypothetical protein